MSMSRPIAAFESPVGAEIVLEGRRYLSFGGSSYLGLASNTEIIEAGVASLRAYGAGAPIPWAHRVATRQLQEVESAAAAFFGREAALYLSCGYHFAFAALSVLRAQFDVVFFDEWSHYCLREAIAASGLESHPFRHLDCEDLGQQIRRRVRAGQRPLVVSDGVYSTFGEIAPLAALASTIEPYAGRLLIDESHSFGVLGDTGRGAAEYHGLPSGVAVIGGSLAKAFGTSGGVIPADADEVRAMRSTPVVNGASLGMPAAAAMCATSLAYVQRHPELLQRLRANTVRLKSGLRRLGLEVPDNVVPIAAFAPSPPKSPRQLKEELLQEGIFVYHTRYIGAVDDGVVRCAVFADHSAAQIDQLLTSLARLL
jgi:8-amino-7-oxononanoate synthase